MIRWGSDPGDASKSNGLPVRAVLRSREISVVEPEDELGATEVGAQALGLRHVVPALAEFVEHVGGNPVLDVDSAPSVYAPARRIRRRLGVLPVVREAYHHLGVALRLHRAAHHAEAHHGAAVPGHERGDDGVERPLARGGGNVGGGAQRKRKTSENPAPRSCREMPVPGTTMPEPKPW
jgi:hypothetical protein